MPSFHRTLPPRADLEQQKKLAKELLTAFDRSDAEARARIRAELPDKNEIVLADAQFVLAREYGFASWAALKEHLEAVEATTRSPLERFKRAVSDRDAPALRRVLERHSDLRRVINQPMFGFDSPALVVAAGAGDPELVEILLDFGADPNRRTNWWAGGFSPLHTATKEIGERLLARGAIADACGAARIDRVDLLDLLLKDDPERVKERGGDGQTPLHFARSREAIDLLLDAGADINARDIDHRSTPAEWMIGEAEAPEESRLPLAKYLVERGASVDIFLAAALGLTDRARELIEKDPHLLSLRTSQGAYAERPPSSYHIYQWTIGPNVTPLQTAAKFKEEGTLNALSELASPQQRLLLACHEGNAARARAIVQEHPGIVESLSGADHRALTDEAWAANARAVEVMMELGFDPSAKSVSGAAGGNALHCAAWEGALACVDAILRYPSGYALLESRDTSYDGTPLSWCCHGSRNCSNPDANHAEVARVLIGAGAKVDPDMKNCSEAMQTVIDRARALESGH